MFGEHKWFLREMFEGKLFFLNWFNVIEEKKFRMFEKPYKSPSCGRLLCNIQYGTVRKREKKC